MTDPIRTYVRIRTGRNWLAWVGEHFEATERTARNSMEMDKSAAAADLKDDTLGAVATPCRGR